MAGREGYGLLNLTRGLSKRQGARGTADGVALPPDSPPSVRESLGLLAEHTARKTQPQGVEFAGGVCYVPSQNICTKVNPLQIFVRSLSYFVQVLTHYFSDVSHNSGKSPIFPALYIVGE